MSMEAGRELDALVAEKVMGWKWWRRENPITGQKWLAESAAPHASMVGAAIPCEVESDLMPEAFDGPDYSRSIAAAWTVVEALKLRSPQHDIHIEHIEGQGWSVSCCYSQDEGGWADAETAPLAICKAALGAIEKSREAQERK